MADRLPPERDDDGPGGIPRWLQIGGLIVALVVLLVVAVMLVGGGHTSPIVH